MQINKVTIAIRPRENWEAADLGYRMVRHWWIAIYTPWLMVTGGIAAALLFFFAQLNMIWAYIVVFWWLKPLYSRLPLYVLSRKVFGEDPGIRETLRRTPALFAISPLWRLLLFRFSVNRSFDMPVILLEGLKGRDRSDRLRVLQRNVSNTMWAITPTSALVQWSIYFFFTMLLVVFMPQSADIKFQDILFPVESNAFLQWYALAAYTASILIFEPFYIAFGFALYLNRRTQLEGWDIELAFHRMMDRLRQINAVASTLFVSIGLGIVLMFSMLLPAPSYAATSEITPAQAKQIIEKVLQDEEFSHKKTVEDYRLKRRNEEKEDKKNQYSERDNAMTNFFGAMGANLAIIGKSIIVLAVLALIIWLAINHEWWLNWVRGIRPAPSYVPPKQLFGLDIRPESLPEQIGVTAYRLWQQGDARGAMSLLYRGALSHFAGEGGVELKESFTEGDCLNQVKRHTERHLSDYFAKLTRVWQMVAYANRPPHEQDAQTLCHEFSRLFEVKT